MNSQKARIAFDMTTLMNSLNKDIARTGIYFASYNIFRNLFERKDIDLTLYSNKPERLRLYLKKNDFAEQSMKIIDNLATLERVDAFFSPGDPFDVLAGQHFPRLSCYAIVYDIIPIIHPEYFNCAQHPSMMHMLSNFNENDHCFSISKCTKNDIIRMGVDINPNRITVIPLGANEHFYQNNDADAFNSVRKKYRIPKDKKYALSLCTREPRKNLITSIRAFIEFIKKNNINDMVYVLAGGIWNIFKEDLKNAIADLGEYSDKIVSIGYADDGDLASLYSNAEWFIYTSHYEGFGLPPLEAMQCGCPVVTSNNSSLPEVVGDAAIMVDSHDLSQHVKAYEDYYFNPELRRENSRKGLERAKLFSWKRAADIICDKIIADVKKKQNTPKASIVIAANCAGATEDFIAIRRRVESVQTQKYGNKELFLMDGCADPSVSEQLRAYAEGSGIAFKPVAGLSVCETFAAALESISGKYAAFLSPAMRYVNDEYLGVCVAKCEELDADLSYADCEVPGDGESKIWRGDIANLPFGEHFCGGAVFVRTDVLRQSGGLSTEYGSAALDEVIMRMARAKKNIIHIRSMKIAFDADPFSKEHAGEYAKAFHDVFGKESGISLSEARDLYVGKLLNGQPDHLIFKLAAKLPVHIGGMALCEKLYKNRHIARFVDDARQADLAGSRHLLFAFLPLTAKYSGTPIRNTTVYYLPGDIPLMKITRREGGRTSYYLFGFLPLFRSKSLR